MSNTFPAPPSPPVAFFTGGVVTPTTVVTQQLPPPHADTSSSPSSPYPSSVAFSFVLVVIIIASAVIVSASIYILLRFLSRRFHRSFRTFAAADDVVFHRDSSNTNFGQQQQQCNVAPTGLLENLPLFTFRSVTGNLTGGDCAVCLSKFEPHDQLRLLPLCCHAFHSACIDTWIVANQTCPLCRSTVLPSDAEVFNKIASADQNRGISGNSSRHGNSTGSFRIEIGSISRRRDGSAEAAGGDRRSYSIGSFNYVLDENGYEVSVGSTTHHRRGVSDCTSADKESSVGIQIPAEVLASEVSGGGGRNWLREYVDRLASVSMSSRAMSFRSSGRFFPGSSRRSDVVVAAEDLEANRVGEEISELFRWLSGI